MIKIISFVDSFKHFEKPILEYQKRLGKKVIFQKLKPSKKNTSKEIIREESLQLEKILSNEKGYKVLLYINSKQLDTIDFKKIIEKKQQDYSDIIFIIGGVFGVDFELIKKEIDFKLSISPMTFPHFMAILILFEQIYRADMIKQNKSYHN